MKRKEIIDLLIKEGFTEKTLCNFNDKQLQKLSERVMNEAVIKQVKVYSMKNPKDAEEINTIVNDPKKVADMSKQGHIQVTTEENPAEGFSKKEMSDVVNKNNFEVGKYLGNNIYEIIRPDGKISEVRFEINIEEDVDPPYGYTGWIEGEDEDYYYTMDANFVDMGGGDYDVDPDYSSLDYRKIEKENVDKEVKEWVNSLAEQNFHSFTSKNEIMELIQVKLNENKPAPSKPNTDAPVREKPKTKPGKPKRENPFEPKHTPKPKALKEEGDSESKVPEFLKFDKLGIKFKNSK